MSDYARGRAMPSSRLPLVYARVHAPVHHTINRAIDDPIQRHEPPDLICQGHGGGVRLPDLAAATLAAAAEGLIIPLEDLEDHALERGQEADIAESALRHGLPGLGVRGDEVRCDREEARF